MYLMQPYDDALAEILDHGVEKSSVRTGVKTLSVFGMCKRYRLDTGRAPIITRRKVWPMSVYSELLWLLEGSTSNKRLIELGCKFWTPWVDPEWAKNRGYEEEDVFGPVYGFNARHFGGNYNSGVHNEYYGQKGFDQLNYMMDRIKTDTSCRRILWSLWNPAEIDNMRLPPCHILFQILIDDERRMTGLMYQRSCDFPIGVPANIQFYSALICMIAQQTDCTPHELVHMTADSHIYCNQEDAVREYLELKPFDSPKLEINKAKDIYSYTPNDFVLSDFSCGPKLEIPLAI